MECCENKMAGFRCGHGRFHGLGVPHLANQDDVRIFPEDGAETVGVTLGVCADLPLIDETEVGLVDILDRVFESNDMLSPAVVDLV